MRGSRVKARLGHRLQVEGECGQWQDGMIRGLVKCRRVQVIRAYARACREDSSRAQLDHLCAEQKGFKRVLHPSKSSTLTLWRVLRRPSLTGISGQAWLASTTGSPPAQAGPKVSSSGRRLLQDEDTSADPGL